MYSHKYNSSYFSVLKKCPDAGVGDIRKSYLIQPADGHLLAGAYIITQKEGKLSMVTVEEYRQLLAMRLGLNIYVKRYHQCN